jgi:hypothetical protein
MLAVWQAADEIDIYESGWTFDHFYPIFGNSSGPCLEGWTTLTSLIAVTPPSPEGNHPNGKSSTTFATSLTPTAASSNT